MRTSLVILATCAACSGAEISDGGDVDEQPVPHVELTPHNVGALPAPGSIGTPIEGYAYYEASFDSISACNNGELRDGMQAFAGYLGQFSIVAQNYASCQTGFHPRGMALDVYVAGMDGKQAFADWLTANDNEMARRLGVVQIVWNYHMWRSYDGGPNKPQGAFGYYGGSNPHTDHVHLSFTEDAANSATSFFTDVIGGGGGGTVSTFSSCGALHVGEQIGTDRALTSCDGRYLLAQQGDGNLVLYRSDGTALWSSTTSGTAGRVAIMQGDGNFVIYSGGGSPIWATGTGGYDGAELALQDDGNVVLYAGGTPIWASGTSE